MSASRSNTDAVSNQGEFHSRIPPRNQQTLYDGKHKPSVENPTDHFTAETHPPGTAPKDRLFKPNPDNDLPLTANAQDSFGGDTVVTTSKTVDTGLGKPMYGQTSHEERHDGHRTRKHDRNGLEGVGYGGKEAERTK